MIKGKVMGKILMTINEYISEIRKKDTIYIEFNSIHAKINLGLPLEDKRNNRWFDKQYINWDKRAEFIQYMEREMPSVKLIDVLDNVPAGYIDWPYLGTIVIDVDLDSQEFKTIDKYYEGEDGQPVSLDAVVYIKIYKK